MESVLNVLLTVVSAALLVPTNAIPTQNAQMVWSSTTAPVFPALPDVSDVLRKIFLPVPAVKPVVTHQRTKLESLDAPCVSKTVNPAAVPQPVTSVTKVTSPAATKKHAMSSVMTTATPATLPTPLSVNHVILEPNSTPRPTHVMLIWVVTKPPHVPHAQTDSSSQPNDATSVKPLIPNVPLVKLTSSANVPNAPSDSILKTMNANHAQETVSTAKVKTPAQNAPLDTF